MIAGGGEQSQLEGSAPPTHTQPQPHSLFPAGPTQSRSRPPRRGRVAVGGGGGMGRAGGRDRLVRRLTRPKPPALASMASPRSRGGGGARSKHPRQAFTSTGRPSRPVPRGRAPYRPDPQAAGRGAGWMQFDQRPAVWGHVDRRPARRCGMGDRGISRACRLSRSSAQPQ